MARNKTKLFQKGLNDIITSIKKYKPEKMILFGSSASGKYHSQSDIDLLVIKDTKEPFWERQIKSTLMYKGLIPTDILVLTPDEYNNALKENRFFLTEEILKKGRVIYEKSH